MGSSSSVLPGWDGENLDRTCFAQGGCWLTQNTASSWGAPVFEVPESSFAMPPCGSHKVDVLSWVSFDRHHQVVGMVASGLLNLTLSKKSSNRQCYCGLTSPVIVFKTR